ncbi:hypothetical protein GCM10020256_37430 [Streptomyces thermocoprophilus]
MTGRATGAATVFVLEPSHVTGLPEEPGALAVGFDRPPVAWAPEA